MFYHDITKCDMKNGEGLRVVLWCSHCEHMCKGCHNQQTWDASSGVYFDALSKWEILQELSKDHVSGLTLSGGDPLSCENRQEILRLIIEVKYRFPTKTIWCYTGYLWEDVKTLEHMKYIDVLVDGKFDLNKTSPSPKWRGSFNQKIIDVQESLKQNKVVLWEG